VIGNLDASASVGTSFSTPVQIYDSLGQSHQMSVTYTKTATNTWSYDVALPTGDATRTPVNTTGTMVFDSSGMLQSPSSAVQPITFSGLTDGAADLSLSWKLGIFTGFKTITQVAGPSTNTAVWQDGWEGGGMVQDFTVDSNGIITEQLGNGQTVTIGQIAVAKVANAAGLIASGNNNFTTTEASGLPSIGVAGSGGRGTIVDNAVEQSNVNISTEFTNLIVAQRAFEANSKTETTFDALSKDILGMIR
jgi:flagellar hook protein FlgE